MVALLPLCLISLNTIAQDLSGIQVKESLTVEFKQGHSCMTQTRSESKEDALYTTDQCGPVKYKLSKKGTLFIIYEKNEAGKWFEWGSYTILHSFTDHKKDVIRYTFYTNEGSIINYVPKTEYGPLVILDLAGEELIHFIYE